jgi:hypothetical protein
MAAVDLIDVEALNIRLKVIKDTMNAPIKAGAPDQDQVERYQRVIEFTAHLEGITDALAKTVENWDNKVAALSVVDIEKIPPSIIDYIDAQAEAGKINNAKDILALFETGELKGIVVNDEIDPKILAAFEKKHHKGTGKALTPDDEVF